MLPDFPSFKRILHKHLRRYLQALIRQRPLISIIKEKPIFEGNRFTEQHTLSEPVNETMLQQLGDKLDIRTEDVIAQGPDLFFKVIKDASQKLSDQQSQLIIDQLNDSAEKTGNITDATGTPFTFDIYLEFLSTAEWEFDDNGAPFYPTVLMDCAEHIRKVQEWCQDSTNTDRIDQLIEQKRSDWSDRESNRKLVD